MMESIILLAKYVWGAFVFILGGLLKLVWDKFKTLEQEVIDLKKAHHEVSDKVIVLESTTITRPELSASIDKVVNEFRGDLRELETRQNEQHKNLREQLYELRSDIKEVVKILSNK